VPLSGEKRDFWKAAGVTCCNPCCFMEGKKENSGKSQVLQCSGKGHCDMILKNKGTSRKVCWLLRFLEKKRKLQVVVLRKVAS